MCSIGICMGVSREYDSYITPKGAKLTGGC